MTRILSMRQVAPKIFEMVLEAPEIAAKARAGQFAVVMASDSSERIPLTLADWDAAAGTVTLILMEVGTSTAKLARLSAGDSLYAFAAPLGKPSEVCDSGTVLMVAGGVGAAPIYPIAKAYHQRGAKVVVVQGARSSEMLFWEDRLAAVADSHVVVTDDGSKGRKGLVVDPLKELLSSDPTKQIKKVYAIGPAIMMKFCALATQPYGVETIVSLNSIMVDGTGMCGGCRVNVGGQARFTCVDGPEFDGHLVDWDLLLSRQKTYAHEERCSLERYTEAALQNKSIS